MTHRKGRILTFGSVLGWVLAVGLPVIGRGMVSIEVLILVDMVILAASVTTTMLAVVVRALPPVAAAWFLGYREASKQPEKDDGRRLRIIGD